MGKGFVLPIEIIPEARLSITKTLEAKDIEVVLREGVKNGTCCYRQRKLYN